MKIRYAQVLMQGSYQSSKVPIIVVANLFPIYAMQNFKCKRGLTIEKYKRLNYSYLGQNKTVKYEHMMDLGENNFEEFFFLTV